MQRHASLFTVTAFLTIAVIATAQSAAPLMYPKAKKGTQVDDYHGTRIADPFRQLEDPDNPETRAWIEAEQKLTDAWLAQIPQRAAIKNRLIKLYNYDRYAASAMGFAGAFSAGKQHFLLRNSGLQNQYVLYKTDARGEHAEVLLDPNTLRADGTAALCGISPSHDGRLMAYGTAQAGSDWCDWKIRNVETGKDLADFLPWIKFTTPTWTPDNRAFYYIQYPVPAEGKTYTQSNQNPRILFHRLGKPVAQDQFIYADREHPERYLGADLTEDGRFLVINENLPDSSKNLLFFMDVSAAAPKAISLTPQPAGIYYPIGSLGSRMFVRTTDGAPKGRIVSIDLLQPERQHWKQVVAEATDTIESAIVAGGKLLVSYLKDAHSTAQIYSLDGKLLNDVAMPGLGSAVWSPAEPDSTELFYSFASFTSPTTLYRLDLENGRSALLRKSELSFDPALYETRQIFYASKDGTRVPMFLVHRRGMKPNGQNPTLLYGYGGFNIPMTPGFSPAILAWMEMGGVYAVANIRGGSEYGEAWHAAGARHQKQNVFDDFIAAAEWLIANHYTSKTKLAIFGGSNGGLLIGACLNQRPDLFAAAMPAVGVMDMLRFQKFTAGGAWIGEYGTSDDPRDFPVLRAYSPLHNIRKVAYPATLITTADHDDRVVPGHSFKYAATLQEAQQGPAPILIRIETRAGHGAGTPTSKSIEEWADRLAFLVRTLGMTHPADAVARR